MNPNDFISQLPEEMQIKILDYLKRSDMKNIVIVSKNFSRLGQDPILLSNKGVYSERLEKIFKENLKPWKLADFREKYANELEFVTALDLRSLKCSLELIKFVEANCPKIRSLFLPKNTQDVWLSAIPKNLIFLNLMGCYQITNKGLLHLKSLKNMTNLNLKWCSQITDIGLLHLSHLKNLTSLNLNDCSQITDVGLSYLSSHTNITYLNLWGCRKITDTGLSHLSHLKNLTSLDLSICYQITDKGLPYLISLVSLAYLNLWRCYQITDEGLVKFKLHFDYIKIPFEKVL